jgi:hypothetical protein
MKVRRVGWGAQPRWLRRPGADRLLAMWATLYPAPALIDVVSSGTAPRPGMERDTEFVVLPAAGGSRMLVPVDRRVGAAMATARRRLVTALPQRALWGGLAMGLRSGVVHALFRDRLAVDVATDVSGSDLTNLGTALGTLFGQDVTLGINVGRARANRKPVVHVLDAGGRTLGFCKVGWNDVTRDLLAKEAATLTALEAQRFQHIDVPRVLFLHQDGDLDYLVVTSLPGGAWMPFRRQEKTFRAMRELAGSGPTERVPLTRSDWWDRTATRAAALTSTTAGPALAGLLTRIEAGLAGGTEVAFGRWHGDWSPWNMTFGHRCVLVWDWERSDALVPVGFDGLHFELQTRLKDQTMTQALVDTRQRAVTILGGFPEQGAAPELVLELYLAALYLRYAEDAIAIEDPALAAAASDIVTFLGRMAAG